MQRHWATIATVFFVVLLFSVPVALAPSFAECVAKLPSYDIYHQGAKEQSYFLFSLLAKFRCTGDFIHVNADSIVAVFTIVLAIATIRLWISTNRLWEGAERASERQLRAYVSAKVESIMLEADGKTLRAFVKIKNRGQTPAFNVKIPSAVNILPAPPQSFLVADELPFTDEQLDRMARFTLSKDGKTGNSPNSQIPSIDNVRKTADDQALYVFGLITYRDVFGEDHWVEFCSFLRRDAFLEAFNEAEKNRDQRIDAMFEIASFGNDASFNPDHAKQMAKFQKSRA